MTYRNARSPDTSFCITGESAEAVSAVFARVGITLQAENIPRSGPLHAGTVVIKTSDVPAIRKALREAGLRSVYEENKHENPGLLRVSLTDINAPRP